MAAIMAKERYKGTDIVKATCVIAKVACRPLVKTVNVLTIPDSKANCENSTII